MADREYWERRRQLRADQILLEAVRTPAGWRILGANAAALVLYLLSSWEIGEVLVAFWVEAALVATVFGVCVALARVSGPTLLHRIARVVLWMILAGGFLALTGLAVSWALGGGELPDGRPTFLPPFHLLGPAPWMIAGWIVVRSVPSFAKVIARGRFEWGIGLAASQFFVIYLPVLAGAAGIIVFTDGAYPRLMPVAFLALLTYFELVMELKLLPLLDRDHPTSA